MKWQAIDAIEIDGQVVMVGAVESERQDGWFKVELKPWRGIGMPLKRQKKIKTITTWWHKDSWFTEDVRANDDIVAIYGEEYFEALKRMLDQKFDPPRE